jgi:glutathione S-transferase kappa 1
MMGSGNKPPITVPNKGAHMGIEMALVAKFAGIKYKFPTPFPVNTINCVRLLRVIEDKAPAQLAAATDLFFAAVWGPEAQAQTAITLPGCFDVVKSLFDEATLKAYIEESGAAANKDRIKADAAKLVAEG